MSTTVDALVAALAPAIRSGRAVAAGALDAYNASTAEAYCPSLRGRPEVASKLAEGANAAYEIVIDGELFYRSGEFLV